MSLVSNTSGGIYCSLIQGIVVLERIILLKFFLDLNICLNVIHLGTAGLLVDNKDLATGLVHGCPQTHVCSLTRELDVLV